MKKLKRGDQRKIAAAIKLSPSMVCDILNGRVKMPPPVFAAYMEEVYGIDRRSWYWPSDYPNPLLKADESQQPEAKAC